MARASMAAAERRETSSGSSKRADTTARQCALVRKAQPPAMWTNSKPLSPPGGNSSARTPSSLQSLHQGGSLQAKARAAPQLGCGLSWSWACASAWKHVLYQEQSAGREEEGFEVAFEESS